MISSKVRGLFERFQSMSSRTGIKTPNDYKIHIDWEIGRHYELIMIEFMVKRILAPDSENYKVYTTSDSIERDVKEFVDMWDQLTSNYWWCNRCRECTPHTSAEECAGPACTQKYLSVGEKFISFV